MSPKQRAAEAAMRYVRSGMTIGLGTGSTADFFILAVGAAVKAGTLTNVRGVPTSVASEHRARELGIAVVPLEGNPPDVTVDGADEVDPQLNLIKGLGGALLREKMVAQNSKKLVIIADASKAVQTLGTRAPLPVEVVPFAHLTHVGALQSLGGVPVLRHAADGTIFVTDNGNYIYDCKFRQIDEPAALERAITSRAGVVGTGLFYHLASIALLAGDSSVETREAV